MAWPDVTAPISVPAATKTSETGTQTGERSG